ncbi:hypothetical protein [Photobacterium minamisatsumaniensis]|uniref:hypothetical protein n=1 Tax=Photobacterium minamisatsumaniensis TaxID=2910233 RepID=UPI003D1093E5
MSRQKSLYFRSVASGYALLALFQFLMANLAGNFYGDEFQTTDYVDELYYFATLLVIIAAYIIELGYEKLFIITISCSLIALLYADAFALFAALLLFTSIYAITKVTWNKS